MRKLYYILLTALSFASVAQQPVINTIAPTHIEVGETVTISGSNLGGRVFFGGVEATSVSGSGNIIEATVPPGVTHGAITVLNNILIARSSQNFYISYSGSTITDYDAEFLLSSGETDAADICICDLDGDDLNDVAITHNVNDSDGAKDEISIYENQSTPAATSFNKLANIDNPENTVGLIAVTCGDLDNDGLPELIFTPNQGSSLKHIYIYRNQSTPGNITLNYLSALNLKLPTTSGNNRIPRQIKVVDIDGDGKQDLVVGNDSDATVHIFRNTSSGVGVFSFATEDEIAADGESSGVLDVADFDGDGKPDIVSMPFRGNNTQIHILRNNSIPGTINFVTQSSITNGGQTNDVATGDFDEDGFIDIAVASRNTGLITTFRNSSSGSTITFDAAENINIASASPFGLDLGDINGDGKIDIVSSFASSHVFVIPNTSTSGNVSFGTHEQINTTSTTQYVCVGDLNGDAKPDIAFTHDISQNGPIGNLGVFINRNCLAPEIKPLGFSFCQGANFRLFATNALDATYTWDITAGAGTPPGSTGANNFADFNIPSGSSVTIEVQVTQSNTTCSTPTATEVFTINNSVTTDPTINGNTGVFCAGDAVTLTSSTTNNNYQWTLPDGSILTSAAINISSVSSSDAGEYTLRVQNDGSCASSEITTTVEVEEAPQKNIVNQGCTGSNITLDIGTSSFNYQWKQNGSDLIGETGSTLQVSSPGTYTVDVETTANMCVTESESFVVPTFTTSAFDIPTETCVDSPIQLVSTSTGDNSFTITTDWEVLDNSDNPINAADTTHTTAGNSLDFSFNATGTYKVRLSTGYSDFEVCPNVLERSIVVSAAPVITFDATDGTMKCQGDTLVVGVTSPTAAEISNYQWIINGDTTTNATAGAFTAIGADEVYAVLELTTTIGCVVKDSVRIVNFPTDADISSPDFDVSSDTVTLEEASSIELVADNVISNWLWSPESIVDNSTASSVNVFPATAMTTVTLTGIDANNCQIATTVTVILDNIRPRRTFSPNGDGVNDFWEILNTDVLVGCEIFIFDSRGRNMKVANSPFTNNQVWDGTSGGNQVPEGLYYFVLKCDDSSLSKSGSILLAR